MSFSFPPNANTAPNFNESEPLLTVQQLKDRYLFGIDLTDKNGKPIPDETFQHSITSALSYLQHKLDITILKRHFLENYDYRAIDYIEFNFIQLKHRPVSEFLLLRAMFPNNQQLVKYPQDWYVVEKESGQIQLSPVEGSFSGLIITQGGSYLPVIYGTRQYWPHLFEVTYTAGFDHDKIPVIINEMIGMQASIRLFDILGDILFGNIASENTSLDGAAASRALTAGAGVSAFAGRIKSYREDLKEYIQVVRQYYNGIPVTIA